MRFLWLCLLADLRGLTRRWPSRPTEPAGYSVVCCACARHDLWGFYKLGWMPFCFRRTAFGGVSRTFLVRNTPEQDAYDRLAMESLARAAEVRDGDDRLADTLDESYAAFSAAIDRVCARPGNGGTS